MYRHPHTRLPLTRTHAHTAAAKNAENDMRLMYKRHKKELTELQDKYKSGELEERYRVATHKVENFKYQKLSFLQSAVTDNRQTDV